MSQHNELDSLTYDSGPNLLSDDWYREHMPCLKTLMEDYLAGFNFSGADFLIPKREISSFLGHGVQYLKSRKDEKRWRDRTIGFCSKRFNGPPLDWSIQAVIWLKRIENMNSKKRKRTKEHKHSPKSRLGEIARPRVIWVAATPIDS